MNEKTEAWAIAMVGALIIVLIAFYVYNEGKESGQTEGKKASEDRIMYEAIQMGVAHIDFKDESGAFQRIYLAPIPAEVALEHLMK